MTQRDRRVAQLAAGRRIARAARQHGVLARVRRYANEIRINLYYPRYGGPAGLLIELLELGFALSDEPTVGLHEGIASVVLTLSVAAADKEAMMGQVHKAIAAAQLNGPAEFECGG